MSHFRRAVVIFLCAAAILLVVHGNRLVLTNDEGILLEPGHHIANGAKPYTEFFAYMSPGSYWIQAALFRVFGFSYWVGRLPVIFDFSLQCGLMFWLAARYSSIRTAYAVVFLYAGFQFADPSVLTAQHRWDSGTLALLGICLALDSRKGRLLASGIVCAAAAWCTPSIALVGVVIFCWLVFYQRKNALAFVSGVGAVTMLVIVTLAQQGNLTAFVRQMLWLQKNYAQVNFMYYGEVMGGYGTLLEGAHGVESLFTYAMVACLALPAILPIAAVLLWCFLVRKNAELRPIAALLVLSMAALIASVVPRADMMHLALIVALPAVLTAIAVARLFPLRVSAITAFTLVPFALLFCFNGVSGLLKSRTIDSPAGSLRADAMLAAAEEELLKHVQPGQTLFVYPYMPVHYFITKAVNPTSFSFLAPGMMTEREEQQCLNQLRAHPPQWLLYMPLSRQEFLRVFPHAQSINNSFPALEAWLEQNYQPTDLIIGSYSFMQFRQAETQVSSSRNLRNSSAGQRQ